MACPLILTVDASGGSCRVALVRGPVVWDRTVDGARGQSANLAALLAAALAFLGGDKPNRVAVVTGPGSFTGLRAALALAQGYGLGAAVPVVGVSLAACLRAQGDSKPVWVAVKTGARIVLDRPGLDLLALAPDAVPLPDRPILVAGDAAPALCAALVARGADAILADCHAARPGAIAALAAAMPVDGAAVEPIYGAPARTSQPRA